MTYRSREQVRPIDLRFMWAVIVALGACLLIGLVVPMDRLDGKGWPARALTYPLSALVVPALWLLRGRRWSFPALANGLLVLPFVLDLAGNLFGLFDNVTNFDDVLHLVNWMFLVGAVVVLMAPLGLARWNVIGLGSGFGAVAIVLWEFMEYVVLKTGTTGLDLTYDDTISDLVLSTVGGLIGATAAVLFGARSVVGRL
jgi:hypothetical protein